MSDCPIIGPCDPIIECAPGSSCTSDKLFSAIYVKPKIIGGAIVVWTLGPNNLPDPLEFKLQVNHAGHVLADGWEDVTDYVADVFCATDP